MLEQPVSVTTLSMNPTVNTRSICFAQTLALIEFASLCVIPVEIEEDLRTHIDSGSNITHLDQDQGLNRDEFWEDLVTLFQMI